MARLRLTPVTPRGLVGAEKAELKSLLSKIPDFDPAEEAPPAALCEALEFVMSWGVRTSARLRAYRAKDGWIIGDGVLDDLRRLAS